MSYKIRVWDESDLSKSSMEIVTTDSTFDMSVSLVELIALYQRFLYLKAVDSVRLYKTHQPTPKTNNDVAWWWFPEQKPAPPPPFEPLPFETYVNESGV